MLGLAKRLMISIVCRNSEMLGKVAGRNKPMDSRSPIGVEDKLREN
jgi:hypothetical protein